MFNIYRMLFLTLNMVEMVRFTPLQIWSPNKKNLANFSITLTGETSPIF